MISMISFFISLETNRKDQAEAILLLRGQRRIDRIVREQEAYEKRHHLDPQVDVGIYEARVSAVGPPLVRQPAPRKNSTFSLAFRLLWDDEGYEDPWPAFRRKLADSCFWTHPAWAAYLGRLRAMRNGSAPKRYLTWSQGKMQGIGNSMQGLLTAFLLAMMSGRAFVINWTSPLALEEVYHPVDVDWRLSQTPEVLAMRYRRAIYYDFEAEMTAQQVSALAYSAEPSVIIESNIVANQQNLLVRNKLSGLGFGNTELLDLVKGEAYLSACVFHSLFALPKEWATQADEWLVPFGPRIGVQLRFGDQEVFGTPSDTSQVLHETFAMTQMSIECAQQLAEQAGFSDPCVIIVESDSNYAKMSADRVGGMCKVWVSNHASKDLAWLSTEDHNRGRTALAMWYAWSRLTAVELLLHNGSSFAATAGRVGLAAVDRRRILDLRQLLPKTIEEPVQCHLPAFTEP